MHMQQGDGIRYAIFRRKRKRQDGRNFTIQFSKKSGGYGVEMPGTAKLAREEWNTLVASGWRLFCA